MQKGYRILLPIALFFFSLVAPNLRAQSLSYELLGQYSSVSDSPDTIKFTPYLPVGYIFCRFEFDVTPDETLVPDEIYIFTTPSDVINVTLYYTLNGGDCTAADPNLTSIAIPVYPKRALYEVQSDKELTSLASLKKVLRSLPLISENNFALLGDLRYFWDFDAKMIPVPDVAFDPNDPAKGQYPNVYYTFPNGGAYEITLKVADINSNDIALFTRVLNLSPDFGSDLINFENVPNVFTPGALTNNHFTVESGGVNELSFRVFSRSGSLVYQHNGNVIKWDGKNFYGQDLPEGIYYYVIEDVSEVKKYNPAKGFFYIYR